MHFSEDDLRKALKRHDPGPGFTNRVMAGISETEKKAQAGPKLGSFFSAILAFVLSFTRRPALAAGDIGNIRRTRESGNRSKQWPRKQSGKPLSRCASPTPSSRTSFRGYASRSRTIPAFGDRDYETEIEKHALEPCAGCSSDVRNPARTGLGSKPQAAAEQPGQAQR